MNTLNPEHALHIGTNESSEINEDATYENNELILYKISNNRKLIDLEIAEDVCSVFLAQIDQYNEFSPKLSDEKILRPPYAFHALELQDRIHGVNTHPLYNAAHSHISGSANNVIERINLIFSPNNLDYVKEIENDINLTLQDAKLLNQAIAISNHNPDVKKLQIIDSKNDLDLMYDLIENARYHMGVAIYKKPITTVSVTSFKPYEHKWFRVQRNQESSVQIKENRNELPETIRDGLLTLKIEKIWGRVGDIQFCTQEDLCLNPNINTTAINHNAFKRIMNTPLAVDGEWIEAIDRDREFHNELMALDLRAEAENFDSVIPLSMIAYARNLYVEEKQKRNKKA